MRSQLEVNDRQGREIAHYERSKLKDLIAYHYHNFRLPLPSPAKRGFSNVFFGKYPTPDDSSLRRKKKLIKLLSLLRRPVLVKTSWIINNHAFLLQTTKCITYFVYCTQVMCSMVSSLQQSRHPAAIDEDDVSFWTFAAERFFTLLLF